MNAKRNIERKDFFKEGPLSLLRAFLDGAGEEPTPSLPYLYDGPILRPPGAAPEHKFLDICEGGGACARACPADAIRMEPRGDDLRRQAPIIRPAEAACVLCDELACMKVCPSGALTLLPREEIQIGNARVETEKCLSWQGEECNLCVDKCPVGKTAIWKKEEEGRLSPAVGDGCVGCGLCEYYCPVFPAAIRVFERDPSP